MHRRRLPRPCSAQGAEDCHVAGGLPGGAHPREDRPPEHREVPLHRRQRALRARHGALRRGHAARAAARGEQAVGGARGPGAAPAGSSRRGRSSRLHPRPGHRAPGREEHECPSVPAPGRRQRRGAASVRETQRHGPCKVCNSRHDDKQHRHHSLHGAGGGCGRDLRLLCRRLLLRHPAARDGLRGDALRHQRGGPEARDRHHAGQAAAARQAPARPPRPGAPGVAGGLLERRA
mmetsp:Transcript_9315/g.29071  ORF Transcript_9315/g.29071 Transcript_9315/m.29071 type:complete len:234 (+) Transcript_9315:337-1038(+)